MSVLGGRRLVDQYSALKTIRYRQVIANFPSSTQFTLQVVLPAVLGSPSGVSMQPCESVANRPSPCKSCVSFKLFKIYVSEFDTMSMCRQFRTCVYEFLTTVTEGCGPQCT